MDIAQIRDQMPGLQFGTYLNTGGIGQSPVCVNQAMAEGYQQMLSGSVGPADQYTKRWSGRHRKCRPGSPGSSVSMPGKSR